MLSSPETQGRRLTERWWLGGLVLAASFGLTVFATYYAARTVRLRSQEEFNSSVYEAQAAVQTRMETYLALLRSAVAFFDANPEVSREAFETYVERLRLSEKYPGIQGFGFSRRVLPEELEAVLAKARKDGVIDFSVWPMVPDEEIHTILYLEPQDRRNRAALGFNMYSEPIRRAAMDQARDRGTAVASARVTLVQEIEGPVQAGFLIYAPVYVGGNVPPSMEERRKAIRGFIYSPFRADDLFRSVIPPFISEELGIRIYDGEMPNNEKLLYETVEEPKPKRQGNAQSPLSATLDFQVAEHTWTMEFFSRATKFPGSYIVPLVFSAGALVSLLLAVLTVSEARARARAELANERLTRSEQSLREARTRMEEHAIGLEQRVAERTARLQETVRDLEAVLYHVAHDLRAPVRAMGSFATILREDYGEKLDDRALGYLDRISSSAARMDRLVYDLLAYGRLAQMPITLEAVSLEKSVSTVLSRAKEGLESRSAEVYVKEPLPEVRGNPGVLIDVISRLLDNALKFVPPEKKPVIRIWADNGLMVRLYIADNGIGIQPEYHERIFRVFEKLQPSGTSGTGIGLAIARKAMERMGGTIGLESTPGMGTRFWVDLEKVRALEEPRKT